MGIINIPNLELLAYVFVFWGLSYVFISFGNNRRWTLFLSTIIFMVGIFLLIYSKFEIIKVHSLIIPSLLMITGIGVLITYIDGYQKPVGFILSFSLIASGLIITITHGEITITTFILSAIKIVKIYWSVILIFLGVLLLFRKRDY